MIEVIQYHFEHAMYGFNGVSIHIVLALILFLLNTTNWRYHIGSDIVYYVCYDILLSLSLCYLFYYLNVIMELLLDLAI